MSRWEPGSSRRPPKRVPFTARSPVPPDRCPPAILDWIARYPEALSEAQQRAVERHAHACGACLFELGMLSGLLDPPVRPADPVRLFARVVAQLDSEPERPRERARRDEARARLNAERARPDREPGRRSVA